MKKLLLAGVAALSVLCAAPGAHATETLLAVMRANNGKLELHQANLKDGFCTQLLANFEEQAKNDQPIWLTLPAPDFTGMVIEAHCVMPDGSKRSFKAGKPS